MYYQTFVLFLCVISVSSAAVVKLLPSTSFNLPINYKDGKLPCSKETVIFPETLSGPVRMDSEISVSGFILPRDGELLLADANIQFGTDQTDVNCTREGNIYYIGRSTATWWQPDVWSSPRINAATPDAERVPCFDDIVEFSTDSQFSLQLPDKTQFLAGIKFNLFSKITTHMFKVLAYSEYFPSHFILNSFMDTGVIIQSKQCLSRAGCPCQQNVLDISCEDKFCSVPTCADPIKPIGHCCKICGGSIVFDIDESFDIMTFAELVEETVKSYGSNGLVYHIGRLPPNKVQLVIVDKEEYSGTSAQVANAIDHRMERHWVQGAKYVGISGSPLDMAGLSGKIFISMLILVVLVMSGIYIYYYRLPEVSNVRFPILQRNAPGVFSRFETRTDSVVCLTRRDSDVPIGRAGIGTAFRNPLYDSTRQRAELGDNLSVSEND
ncbi:protein amnionless [Epargyreus clarus]|uniref:protein amnionless n=1 Tax=Epargyreus clarus TaxID=520877 RepID=UPI003C2C4A62